MMSQRVERDVSILTPDLEHWTDEVGKEPEHKEDAQAQTTA